MPRNRFVEPETVRLELTDGDWIEVKKELTYGEEQRLAGAAMSVKSQLDGDKQVSGDIQLDMENERFAVLRFYLWLVDWSFINKALKPVKLTKAAIANLQHETADEIDQVLTRHIARVEEERKNVPSPTP